MVKVVRRVDRIKGLLMFCVACTVFFIFFHCGTVKAQETETPEKVVDVGSSMLSEEENNKMVTMPTVFLSYGVKAILSHDSP